MKHINGLIFLEEEHHSTICPLGKKKRKKGKLPPIIWLCVLGEEVGGFAPGSGNLLGSSGVSVHTFSLRFNDTDFCKE